MGSGEGGGKGGGKGEGKEGRESNKSCTLTQSVIGDCFD